MMKHKMHPGLSFGAKLVLLSFLLFTYSCNTETDVAVPDQDPMAAHVKYLAETTGYPADVISYEKGNDRFVIDDDILISRAAVEDYMAGKHRPQDEKGRTQQRRWQYLLSDGYVTNFKYAIPSNIPSSWRTAIQQAIGQWNAVGGTKVYMSEVASGAHITVSISYDAVNNWVARASLPLSNGAPGPTLEINSYHNNMAADQKLFAMVHEIGHNVGLLHTNQTDGALIPGTPTTDPNSVMNSFVLPWNGFTEYDRIAVRNLYPGTTNAVTTVYADCNFSGAAAGLAVGDYNLSAMLSRGIGNDWMSSLRVASGYRVTLYEHDNFSGAALVLTSDNSCLVGAGWNDRVSSMRVATNTSSFSTTIEAENWISMAGVQTEACSEGGLNVGWIEAGDWMAYNVNIPSAGTYRISYRVASPNSGTSLRFERESGTVNLGTVGIPNTGGWQNWTSVSHDVSLPAGVYAVGIATSTGGFNINRFNITKL